MTLPHSNLQKEDMDMSKVKVYIPRGASNDEPNLFVSVNGVNYLLPKGHESEVPEHIANEINRSIKAAQARDMKKDQMIGAAQKGQ